MERPRYLYRAASSRQRYPCWPVWYRERNPIKKHFRVLDCENVYDSDDFYKIELNVRSDPAYTQYVSPSEFQRFQYQKRARLRAEAIVREIETYKQNAVWRKRLTRAKNEFEFVWEPYEKALRKKYGWDWKWQRERKIYEAEMQADLDRRRDEYLVEQERLFKEQHPQGVNGCFTVKRDTTLDSFSLLGYGPAERAHDLKVIERGMKWIDGFQNPYFTRIVAKVMDEQRDIRDQVKLIVQIEKAAHSGELQPILEELNRKAGLYA